MSHNTVGIKVFVSNVTPVTFVQTGSQTLTITCDNNASEMTEVVIPSGLGTLKYYFHKNKRYNFTDCVYT